QPVGLKRQLEIRQSDRTPVLARVLVVSANGAATIASEQEIVATEHVAAAPAGVFSGAALPRTRVKTNAGPVASLPSMRTLTLAEVTTRLGRSPVQPDATSGFHLDQVMT